MWLFIVVMFLILQSPNVVELIELQHLNPQAFMNFSEICDSWGYPHEEYEITTADKYILLLNRIPYGAHNSDNTGSRPAVLLVHGLLDEGRCWIANLPSKSLGFVLADSGYDVWISNTRGTTWSRKHENLTTDQEEFWDFSFHEVGIYDVPASIDFILQKTQQDSLYYVGHSQGGAAGLIAFSLLPEVAQKVRLFTAFAPAYNLEGMSGLLALLLSLPEKLTQEALGKKELQVYNNGFKKIIPYLCSGTVTAQLCLQVGYTIFGYNPNVNRSRMDVYFGFFPDSTSTKTAYHWQQVYKTKRFQQYDYGSRNKEVYNTTIPPSYNIENMTVPLLLLSGENDIQVTKRSMEMLIDKIPNLASHKTGLTWDHQEVVWGDDGPVNIYPHMLDVMQQYKEEPLKD